MDKGVGYGYPDPDYPVSDESLGLGLEMIFGLYDVLRNHAQTC